MHRVVHGQKEIEPAPIRARGAVLVQIWDRQGDRFYTRTEFRLQLIWKGRICHRFLLLQIQREGVRETLLAQTHSRKRQRSHRLLVPRQRERRGAAALGLEIEKLSFAVAALELVAVHNVAAALVQEGLEPQLEMSCTPETWTVQNSSAVAAGDIHVASFEQLESKYCKTEQVPLEQVVVALACLCPSLAAAALTTGYSVGEQAQWAAGSLMAELLRSSFHMDFVALQVAAAASSAGCSWQSGSCS